MTNRAIRITLSLDIIFCVVLTIVLPYSPITFAAELICTSIFSCAYAMVYVIENGFNSTKNPSGKLNLKELQEDFDNTLDKLSEEDIKRFKSE